MKHVEKSLYTKDGEVHVSGERPHYYHADKRCILRKRSYFKNDLFSTETDTMDHLTSFNRGLVESLQQDK